MGRRGGPRGPYRVAGEDDDADDHISPRATAEGQRLTTLEADTRVRAAALIGDTFGLDPIAVLAERDPLRRLIRIAAHNIVQNEHQRAQQRK